MHYNSIPIKLCLPHSQSLQLYLINSSTLFMYYATFHIDTIYPYTPLLTHHIPRSFTSYLYDGVYNAYLLFFLHKKRGCFTILFSSNVYIYIFYIPLFLLYNIFITLSIFNPYYLAYFSFQHLIISFFYHLHITAYLLFGPLFLFPLHVS